MNGNVIMNVPEELVKWADFSLQTLNSMLVEKFNSIKSKDGLLNMMYFPKISLQNPSANEKVEIHFYKINELYYIQKLIIYN